MRAECGLRCCAVTVDKCDTGRTERIDRLANTWRNSGDLSVFLFRDPGFFDHISIVSNESTHGTNFKRLRI